MSRSAPGRRTRAGGDGGARRRRGGRDPAGAGRARQPPLVAPSHRRRGVGRALLAGGDPDRRRPRRRTCRRQSMPGARDVNRYLARLGFVPLVSRRIAPTALLRRSLGLAPPESSALQRRARIVRGGAPRPPRGCSVAAPDRSLDGRRGGVRRQLRPSLDSQREPPGCCCSTATRWPTARSSPCRSRTSRRRRASRRTPSTGSRRCSSTCCATRTPRTSRWLSTSAARPSATRRTRSTRPGAARRRRTSAVRSR